MKPAVLASVLIAFTLTPTGCSRDADPRAPAEEAAGVALAGTLGARSPEAWPPGAASQGASPGESQGLDSTRTTAIVRAAERVSPAVVSVYVLRQTQVRTRSALDDFFAPFLPPVGPGPLWGSAPAWSTIPGGTSSPTTMWSGTPRRSALPSPTGGT